MQRQSPATTNIMEFWVRPQANVVPDGIWDLVELALQARSSSRAPTRADLDAAIGRACKETRPGTYLGSTLRFLLKRHGCPADV